MLELWARQQILECLNRYCTGVDRKDFELMRSAYHDDAYDDHGVYKGDADGLIEWVRNRHAEIDQSLHFLGNVSVALDGERAKVETYCTVHQRVCGEGASPMRVELGCRYLDLFEDRGAGWRIAERVVAFEWWRERDCSDELPLGPEWTRSLRSSDDALYRIGEGAGGV